MAFNSYMYILLFLPLTLAVYHRIRNYRNGRFANIWLVLVSYVFYAYGGLLYLVPLVISSLVDYCVALKISQPIPQSARKKLFIAAMAIDLGLLSLFKYSSWLVESINAATKYLGIPVTLPSFTLPLPPGISFYTFQTMCYTIDVYRGNMEPCRNLVDYATYVTFWPQLVAGPIERASRLLPQLTRVRPKLTLAAAMSAVTLISWGLFKKIVLADNFGHIVDLIDAQFKGGNYHAGAGFIFAYAFAGQIYCDFSGYSDIAIGSARLVGVDLMRNFLTPYLSVSAQDFWRRWHISLSSWLRDYVYIPLGGSWVSRHEEFRNLTVTMFLVGLWHGAGVLFIVWGLYHGLLLILYRLVPLHEYLKRWFGVLGTVLSMFILFQLVCIGWIFFRADTTTLIPIFKTIFNSESLTPIFYSLRHLHTTPVHHYVWALTKGVVSLWIILIATELVAFAYKGEFGDVLARLPEWAKVVFLVICYFGIVLLGKREGVQFVYFQF